MTLNTHSKPAQDDVKKVEPMAQPANDVPAATPTPEQTEATPAPKL